MASKRKVIITVAQTGNFQGKAANPALPEQPSEIVSSAYDCYNAGASIVHIHARDKAGNSTNDPDIFAEINTAVRAKCPIIIQNSTAPAMGPDSKADDGVALLEMKDKSCLPEMCSLDCSLITTVWGDLSFIYRWEREWLLKNAKKMMDLGIKPELRSLQSLQHRGRIQRARARRRGCRSRVPHLRHGHEQGQPGRHLFQPAEP